MVILAKLCIFVIYHTLKPVYDTSQNDVKMNGTVNTLTFTIVINDNEMMIWKRMVISLLEQCIYLHRTMSFVGHIITI